MISSNFFSLALFALSPLLAQAQSGGYANTCGSCFIQYFNQGEFGNSPPGWYLDCYDGCGTGHGEYVNAAIQLGSCFGNHGGNIVFQHNGGFGSSCNNVKLSGSTMTATCGNGHGGYQSSSVNLNNYIGNSGGNLVC